MVNYFLIKEPRIYNGKRIVSSKNDVGKVDIHMQKNEVGLLPNTTFKT